MPVMSSGINGIMRPGAGNALTSGLRLTSPVFILLENLKYMMQAARLLELRSL